MLSEDLPARLKELLHVPPTLLRRLSAVKLRILVRLYLKIFTKDTNTEDGLCRLMGAAIEVCSQELAPLWRFGLS